MIKHLLMQDDSLFVKPFMLEVAVYFVDILFEKAFAKSGASLSD